MNKKIDTDKILRDILIEKQSEATLKDYKDFIKWFETMKSTDAINENMGLISIITEILKGNSVSMKDRVKIAFSLGYWVGEKHRQSNKSEL
jgi:hypothetical protein